MANSDVIIEWLKEAGARAFELESSDRPGGRLLVDLVVSGGIVGIRIRRAGERAFDCLTWSELERAEAKDNGGIYPMYPAPGSAEKRWRHMRA